MDGAPDIIKNSWAGGVAQVVECLPSKYQALNSSPSAMQKKSCM
jgi:hypothetical protein